MEQILDCGAKIQILESNQVYRVTDLFLHRGIRFQQDIDTILTDADYQDTILFDYLKQAKSKADLDAFRKVVNQHKSQYEMPAQDSLIIHLRLGDVLDDQGENNDRPLYQRYHDFYSKLTQYQFPAEIKSATIVTALHYGANPLNNMYFFSEESKQRSLEILKLVASQLKSLGLPVLYKSTTNVDEDLCFMAGSKYYFKSFSGLSNLIAECTDYGTTVWSTDSFESTKKTKLKEFTKRLAGLLKRINQKLLCPLNGKGN